VQTLTLTNTGTAPLVVYYGAILWTGTNTGQFDMVMVSANNCLSVNGVTVPVGGSCALDIQHKPSAGALVGTTYTANLNFNLNVPVNPSVSLTGTLFTGLRTYYIHSDHLDSPRSITNTAGQEVWRWDNTDPFGNNIANENPANLGAFTFNPRFPGQYFDRETGLHYNVNRDYNPAVGRYVESDPIGLRGGINTFGYVNGNPLVGIDPQGLAGIRGRSASPRSSGYGASLEYEVLLARIRAIRPDYRPPESIGRPGSEPSEAEVELLRNDLENLRNPQSENQYQCTAKEIKTRPTKGADGGTSEHIIEREVSSGDVISKTHRVTTDEEVVHQHQEHVGQFGAQRSFPDAWVEYPRINADK
jgi:RHS repeat-associated protein